MTEYVVATVAVLALVALVAWALDWCRARRLAVRERVVVNLLDGEALSGVLWARRARWLVLREASHHSPGNSKPTPLDGETIVDASQVSFVQRVGG